LKTEGKDVLADLHKSAQRVSEIRKVANEIAHVARQLVRANEVKHISVCSMFVDSYQQWGF